MRFWIVIWLCIGALGLGLVVLESSKRRFRVSKLWYFSALLLGPIFLFFVFPLWLGKWGRNSKLEGEYRENRESDSRK